MRIDLDGTALWFDVDGAVLVPNGHTMDERPTVLVLHGGPGFDHSLYKEDLWRLSEVAQVVYLDQRGHGRSTRSTPETWTIEVWADDVRRFCEALDIQRPIVWGHSFGAGVAAAYAARHPDHPGGVVLQSATARHDPERIAAGFGRAGGPEVAELARAVWSGDPQALGDYMARAFPLYGPWIPDDERMARTILNEDLLVRGPAIQRDVDLTEDLGRIRCPVLVCVGELDPLTQVTDAEDIVAEISDGRATMEVVPEAGHFTWKDAPDRYWPLVRDFVERVGRHPAMSTVS